MIGMSRMTMVTRMTNKKKVLIGMTSMAMQNYELDEKNNKMIIDGLNT